MSPIMQYIKPENYIKRTVVSINNQFDFFSERNQLKEVITEKHRVTILGVAGLGKSIELEYLAYHFSKKGSKLTPLLINLNNVTMSSIEDLVSKRLSNFDNIEKEKLIILLDALDEVHVDYIDVVASSINLFAETYPDVKIVVSCRNNFYSTEKEKGTAKLKTFETFILSPLEHYAINNFIKEKVTDNPDGLIENLDRLDFYNLLSSPFYLVNIVAYFNEKGELPNSKKELFEFLMEKRFEKDLEKFQNSGVKLEQHKNKIYSVLEQIAMIMLEMGQNHLRTDQVFEKTIDDETLRESIEYSFLFSKSNLDSSWQFEHNNFKEYLAARYLSNFSLAKIQSIISINGERKRIKPNWLNAVSLLFSIISDEKKSTNLLNWILRIEPDVLVRFEKDKLELNIREKLFRNFYDSYLEKQVIIRNEKFQYRDLALMVSESEGILNYIIQVMNSSDEHVTTWNTICLFEYFDILENYHDAIQDTIYSKIINPDTPSNLKYECLNTLKVLNIYSLELTDNLIANIDLYQPDQYVRTGFYNYLDLLEDHELNNYINLLLSTFPLLRKMKTLSGNRDESPAFLFEEESSFIKLFKKLKSLESIREIFSWSFEEDIQYDSVFWDIMSETIDKSSKFNEEEKTELTPLISRLLIKLSNRIYDTLDSNFKNYFENLENSATEINSILNIVIKDEVRMREKLDAYALVSNEKSIINLINQVENGVFNRDQLRAIRNSLNYKADRKLFDKFYTVIIGIYPDLKYPKRMDWDDLKKKRDLNDRKLLSDRSLFINKVKSIFKEIGEESYSLENAKLHRLDEEVDNTVTFDLLKSFLIGKSIERVKNERVLKCLEHDAWWRGYKVNKLYEWEIHDEKFEFDTNEKQYIRSWLDDNLDNLNFKNGLIQTENGFQLKSLEFQAYYLIRVLNYEINEGLLLDLISMDGPLLPKKGNKHSSIDSTDISFFEWLSTKLDLNKIKARILENIENKAVIQETLIRHYSHCARLNWTEARSHIYADLQDDHYSDYDKTKLVDYFIKLGGKLNDLNKLLANSKIELATHILEKHLEIKDYDTTIILGKQLLKEENDSERQLRYINLIINANEHIGFKLQINWIVQRKHFPDSWYKYKKLNENALSDLLFLYQKALILNFGKSSWGGQGRNDCFIGIIRLGSENKRNYKLVKKYLNSWLEYAPDEKTLHYQLQKLDQEFYLKQVNPKTFEAAHKIVRNGYVKRTFFRLISVPNQKLSFIINLFALLGGLALIYSFIAWLIGLFDTSSS